MGLWLNPATRAAMLTELKTHGHVLNHEAQFRVKSGDIVTLLYSAELLSIDGDPCVLAAAQDMTALKEVEARHRAILKAIPDWTFLQSRDGVYLECQVRDPRNLLMPPEKFVGRNMRDVLPPDLAARLADCFDEALKSDQPVTLNYSLWLRDELRFYEVRLVATDNDQILSLVRDMTEQKQAEYRARELQDELAHVGRVMALGTLTGSLAHEINQPLTAIMANARAAERCWTPIDLTCASFVKRSRTSRATTGESVKS
jgi:PAS domain-containing protein